MNSEAETNTRVQEEQADTASPAGNPVRKATLLTLGLIVVLLSWYLAADRFTPFSSQARINAYVIPIAPQVTGNVLAVNVENNQLVTAGDVLLQLDDTKYVLAVDKAKADLEQAEQQFGASSAGVDSAAASVTAAEAELVRAQKDYDRQKRIRVEDAGAISQRRLDLAESTLAAAKSRVAAAKSELERARQNRGRDAEENAGILAARSALNQAELDLAWTRVKAPADGLVTDLQLEIGALAQPGKPLMTFVGIKDVWLQADLRENNLGHIKTGDVVDIALDVQPGRILKGKVRSIGFGVDAGTSTALGSLPTVQNDRNWLREAQRFPVIIEIDAAGSKTVDLRIGAQATVMVYTENSFLLLPLGKIYMRLVSLFSYLY
ncbi:MAG: HlyD family secretion protein [Gammaproteobacteria bacterium]|jgi:multidrug resistance efflux pump